MFSPQSIILKLNNKYIHTRIHKYVRVTIAAFSMLLHFSQILLPSAAKMLLLLFALKEQCPPSFVQPRGFLNPTYIKTQTMKNTAKRPMRLQKVIYSCKNKKLQIALLNEHEILSVSAFT